MTTLFRDIVQQGFPFVFVHAGGGSSFLTFMHEIPGSSGVVLAGHDLYAREALTRYIGRPVAGAVSMDTAVAMAMKAYEEAVVLHPHLEVRGVSCTAALATTPRRKGADHAWICMWTREGGWIWHVALEGEERKPQEEQIAHNVAEMLCGRSPARHIKSPDPIYRLIHDNTVRAVYCGPRSMRAYLIPSGIKGVLCGSFHPLHGGHRYLVDVSKNILGGPVAYEISAVNVDKGQVSAREIHLRLEQFNGSEVIITQAATFREKCKIFKGVHFIVGADTAQRILDPKYGPVEDTLNAMREAGNKFLVFGRPTASLSHHLYFSPEFTGDSSLLDLFQIAEWGKTDLSSSAIRAAGIKEAACFLGFSKDHPGKWWVLRNNMGYRNGFNIPGGKMEEGESPSSAAIRELGEETGLRPIGRPELLFTSMCGTHLTYTYIGEVEGTPLSSDEGTPSMISREEFFREAFSEYHSYNEWVFDLAESWITGV